MKPRPAYAEPQTIRQAPKAVPQKVTLPVAVSGISSARSSGMAAPGFAWVIENGYTTQKSIKPRGGGKRYANTGTRAVRSFLLYGGDLGGKLFAAAQGGLFDVSSVSNPNTLLTAAVTGKINDEWVGANVTNAGGRFLIAVNGADLHMVYNGTAWASNTPAITGTTSDNFSHVWVYANRVWFIKKNSLSAYYLAVDAIGGVPTEYPLQSVFKKGGSLLFGATWSTDSGSGLAQRCVFVTTEGEAAVYAGTNPASATDWQKVGVYDVSKTLGKYSYSNIGGELVLLTEAGLVSLSEAFTKDTAALDISSVTKEISPTWAAIVSQNSTRNFMFTKWPNKKIGYVHYAEAFTAVSGTDTIVKPAMNLTVNLNNGAWSNYTGWDMQCSALFNGQVYFGSANGKIYAAESGGNDDGVGYVFRYAEWPASLKMDGATATYLQISTAFTYTLDFNEQVDVATNNILVWPSPLGAAPDPLPNSQWDTGFTWDTGGFWDLSQGAKTRAAWRSVGRTGYTGAPMVQIAFNNTLTPDVEIISHTLTVMTGAVVA